MLTTTALVLLTITATVTPINVSPTVSPTYTTREFEIYSRGWKDSVKNYNCIMLCDRLQTDIDLEQEIKKSLLKIDPKCDPYHSGPADASYYKKDAKEIRKEIKEKKCNCSKYKDK